jgi:hypothetical protein
MRRSRGLTVPLSFDALGLAAGTALIAGALSVVAGFLVGLVGTLAALALASWIVRRGQAAASPRAYLEGGRGIGLGVLALGAAIFAVAGGEVETFRGLILAVSLVPLWWRERSAGMSTGRLEERA